MTQSSRFRALLQRDGMIVAPGAYDCITAKLIEQAGFAAVYMTGAGTAATLGYPDYGLLQSPGSHVAIDLETQTATGPDGAIDRFDIDPFRKECLLAGTDDISFTLGHRERIAAFENDYEAKVRWL